MQVANAGGQVDQAAGDHLLDGLLDLRVGLRRQHAVGLQGLGAGQEGAAVPFAGVAVHGVGQRPEQVAPGHHFADLRLHAAELQGAGALQGLVEGAGDEVELDRQAGAALHREQPAEATLGEPLLAALEVAVDQYVLPGDEHLVHHQDRVVLVETAGQRVVERRSGDTRHQFVGGAADQLHAGGVHRRDEHQGEVGVVAEQLRRTLADEVVVGQRGIRGDHLGAADDDAAVDFLVHRDEHILDLVHRLVAVDRRVDDGMVEVQAGFLDALVPGFRVVLETPVEARVGAEGAAEGGLVVRGAAHPAVG